MARNEIESSRGEELRKGGGDEETEANILRPNDRAARE